MPPLPDSQTAILRRLQALLHEAADLIALALNSPPEPAQELSPEEKFAQYGTDPDGEEARLRLAAREKELRQDLAETDPALCRTHASVSSQAITDTR